MPVPSVKLRRNGKAALPPAARGRERGSRPRRGGLAMLPQTEQKCPADAEPGERGGEGSGWGREVPGDAGRCRPPLSGGEGWSPLPPGLRQPSAASSRASPLTRGLSLLPRHADGIFNKAYRKLLGSLLVLFRGGGGLGDDAEPLTKRHIDGIFTDSYSRYRKQMAVKKYLAAVLGKRYKQRVKNKGRRVAYL
uniref:Adenylate cyclase activating polypeptide 1 n=1 Tax=Malurus cyaneus samueli TaxID=2593467 RepID=A0A8C5TSD6_9PASS